MLVAVFSSLRIFSMIFDKKAFKSSNKLSSLYRESKVCMLPRKGVVAF